MLPSVAQTRVSLLTASPGSAIYELDGHTGLRITNDSLGYDQVINWGLFDFEAPNFVYRFVKGETDYMCGAVPAEYFINSYLRDGRTVTEQILDLTPAQTERLTAMIRENLLPGNRVYRYNYVKDNCATRPLDMIEAATGRRFEFGDTLSGITYRDEMRFNHRYYPWYQFGIDIALGSGIDYLLSRREMTFAPAELDKMLVNAEVGGRKLVSHSFAMIDFPEDNAVDDATPWYLSPLAVCWLFFALALALTVYDIRRRRVSRWFDAIYFGLLGLAGCVLTYLIFISVHEATSPNYLYLWLNPLCLLVPCLIFVKRTSIVLNCFQIVNFAVLLALLAVWPFLPQSANPAFLPLVGAEILRAASYIYITRKAK